MAFLDSSPIASDVGHGALGLRYGLRPFRDLLGETVGQRHLWVDLRPKKLLASASWTAYGGGVYYQALADTIDGVPVLAVGVRTLTETLTRVDTGASIPAGAWTQAADGSVWVHLTADANPASTSVVVELGVHVGSHGVVQPVLGPDRLTNGSFDAWTGTTPDGWALVASDANITEAATSSDPLQGSYAARLTATAATAQEGWYQDVAVVAGLTYRISGAYRNSNAQIIPVALVYKFVGSPNDVYMQLNGRDAIVNVAGYLLAQSVETPDWRRFTYDFLVPTGWTSVRIFLYAQVVSGTQTGTVDFDDIKLEQVQRYVYHEPLLSLDSLPTIEAARSDSFWGEMSSALGSLSLLNGGGRLEPLLAAYDWLGADAIVRVGGRYQLGGNETPIEDCPIIATGKLGAPTVTDSGITFDLQDDRRIRERVLPDETYNNNNVDAYTQPDRGRVRPLLFGTKLGIRPVQYDIHYTGGGAIPLGKYEVVDCTDWTTGIKEITQVYWYADEQAATAHSAIRRKLVPGYDTTVLSPSLTTGRFDVLLDARPLFITQENNKVHYDVGGALLTAAITPGIYAMHAGYSPALTAAITNAMGGGFDPALLFSPGTQKARFWKSAGTFNLRCATGSDVQMGIWSVLGFDASADKTGALVYDADTVFTSQAYDQILRVDAIGFKDDTSGTYTGTPSATIEKACDIARFLLRVVLGVPASAIDLPSFVTARLILPGELPARPCSLYLGYPRTVGEVFSELETSGNFDLVLNGGVWYCLRRDATTPAGTPELVDADFLSFESYYSEYDIYGTVTLTYNESPDGGDPINAGRANIGYAAHSRTEMGEATNATVALRHGRPDSKTFVTCLRDAADATTGTPCRLTEIAAQTSTKRRRFRFSTKGKALQVPVSGKLLLTRTRGLDTTGALSQVLVRVLSKRDDWARWVSDVEAIEVI